MPRTRRLTLLLAGSILIAAPAFAEAPAIVAACKACHAEDGSGVGIHFVPVITGTPAVHIEEALYAYKDGARQCVTEPAMCQTVALLTDEQKKQAKSGGKRGGKKGGGKKGGRKGKKKE